MKKLSIVAMMALLIFTGCAKNEEAVKEAPVSTSELSESQSNEDASLEETSTEEDQVAEESKEEMVVKLTTTTSVNDSGLMEYLRDSFKEDTGYDMEIVSKGTGAAIEDAKAGNADVILVHSKDKEEEFVSEGYGIERKPFMHNYFVIVGPESDPAGIEAMEAEDAFKAIADTKSVFASRGDESGTHNKELKIWDKAGVNIEDLEGEDNYNSLGDGMGATLTFASEYNAYTLTDLSTFLTMQNDLNLKVLVDESESLKNVYSVIVVNPDKVNGTNQEAGKVFQDWMLSDKAASLIEEYGKDDYGEQLFFIGE
ncbi:MAG: substrate-binding domain-containing protein [Anaerococcus sp.]|nr:substrate-binding domain-containing protein [Anaerococcus sp.]MDD7044562.1 substrate-binding domain-containing protein [Peptoniphilaceae bacterium]MDY2919074.1 substrate-binding domain-containing protein [Anaerococcus sp.]